MFSVSKVFSKKEVAMGSVRNKIDSGLVKGLKNVGYLKYSWLNLTKIINFFKSLKQFQLL